MQDSSVFWFSVLLIASLHSEILLKSFWILILSSSLLKSFRIIPQTSTYTGQWAPGPPTCSAPFEPVRGALWPPFRRWVTEKTRSRTELSARLHAPPLFREATSTGYRSLLFIMTTTNTLTDTLIQSLLEGERNYGWNAWMCVYVGCVCMCGVQTLLFIALISLFSFLSTHRHHFNNYWYSHASQMWNFYSRFSVKASICLNSVRN